MLQHVKQSLQQELEDDKACNSEEQEEDLQQQLDEITCQFEDVQRK